MAYYNGVNHCLAAVNSNENDDQDVLMSLVSL